MNRQQFAAYDTLSDIIGIAAEAGVDLTAFGGPIYFSQYGPILDPDDNPWLGVWISTDWYIHEPNRYATALAVRRVAAQLGLACSFRHLDGEAPYPRILFGRMYSPNCPPHFTK